MSTQAIFNLSTEALLNTTEMQLLTPKNKIMQEFDRLRTFLNICISEISYVAKNI